MIERYTRKEMARIWEAENKFRIWLEIETLACEKQADLGIIPREAVRTIREKGNFDIARIDAIEAEVKHDVIAFLTSVAEFVGPEARFIHQGMTSSDVLDTCFSVQLVQAADELLGDLDRVLASIQARALEHKDTVCMGRSHGIHAEPVTFGLKLAGWYAEMKRNRQRLQAARENIATGAISGAVGTFAHIDPAVEEYVCEKLGLKPEPVSTQVIPRDRHAEYFCTLAVIASSVERIAVEIRHLQRTEVLEAEEFFSKGQKGSQRHAAQAQSDPLREPHRPGPPGARPMPCRLWRTSPSGTNGTSPIPRLSATSAPMPPSTLDFALRRLNGLISNLVVYPQNMLKNLNQMKGLVFSQKILLDLTQAGVSREDAYRLVQRNAMKVWEEGKDFQQELLADPEVSGALGEAKIRESFDLSYHLKHVDTIFKRVFGQK